MLGSLLSPFIYLNVYFVNTVGNFGWFWCFCRGSRGVLQAWMCRFFRRIVTWRASSFEILTRVCFVKTPQSPLPQALVKDGANSRDVHSHAFIHPSFSLDQTKGLLHTAQVLYQWAPPTLSSMHSFLSVFCLFSFVKQDFTMQFKLASNSSSSWLRLPSAHNANVMIRPSCWTCQSTFS